MKTSKKIDDLFEGFWGSVAKGALKGAGANDAASALDAYNKTKTGNTVAPQPEPQPAAQPEPQPAAQPEQQPANSFKAADVTKQWEEYKAAGGKFNPKLKGVIKNMLMRTGSTKVESVMTNEDLRRLPSKSRYLYEGLTLTEARGAMLWENAGRKLIEANLTADQISQIFQNVASGASASGSNRTMLGKGADAASAVNKAYTDLKSKVQSSAPIAGFDDKFAGIQSKLAAKCPTIMPYVQKYQQFAKQHPIAQGLIYSALIAALGVSGAGAGGAAALGIMKFADKLLQGEKFSTATGQGIKTGGIGYAAGQLGQHLRGQAPETPGATTPSNTPAATTPQTGGAGHTVTNTAPVDQATSTPPAQQAVGHAKQAVKHAANQATTTTGDWAPGQGPKVSPEEYKQMYGRAPVEELPNGPNSQAVTNTPVNKNGFPQQTTTAPDGSTVTQSQGIKVGGQPVISGQPLTPQQMKYVDLARNSGNPIDPQVQASYDLAKAQNPVMPTTGGSTAPQTSMAAHTTAPGQTYVDPATGKTMPVPTNKMAGDYAAQQMRSAQAVQDAQAAKDQAAILGNSSQAAPSGKTYLDPITGKQVPIPNNELAGKMAADQMQAAQAAKDQAAAAKQAAILSGKPVAESLTEAQVSAVIYRIMLRERAKLLVNEGIMSSAKGLLSKATGAASKVAGKVATKAKTVGSNLTNKITVDKLQSAWKKAGSPADSEQVMQVLTKAGADQATVQKAIQGVLGQQAQTTPGQQPATNTNQPNGGAAAVDANAAPAQPNNINQQPAQQAGNNMFSDPAKLEQEWETFLSNGGSYTAQLRGALKDIWMNMGGTKVEESMLTRKPKVLGNLPQKTVKDILVKHGRGGYYSNTYKNKNGEIIISFAGDSWQNNNKVDALILADIKHALKGVQYTVVKLRPVELNGGSVPRIGIRFTADKSTEGTINNMANESNKPKETGISPRISERGEQIINKTTVKEMALRRARKELSEQSRGKK